MKKSLFFAGALLFLFSCSKEKIASESSVEALSAKAEADPGRNTVHIINSTFSPAYLEVNVNNNVAWRNEDNITHTVTSDKFDSGDILPGTTFKMMFANTGTYNYYCKYHAERGTLVVEGIR